MHEQLRLLSFEPQRSAAPSGDSRARACCAVTCGRPLLLLELRSVASALAPLTQSLSPPPSTLQTRTLARSSIYISPNIKLQEKRRSATNQMGYFSANFTRGAS